MPSQTTPVGTTRHLWSVFCLASTSMVVLAVCEASVPALLARPVCPLTTPVFHPVFRLDGAPKSGAYVFELFVPKTSTMMSKKQSKCQMENEPMNVLLTSCGRFYAGASATQ